jgi:hypothetical protein
MPTIIRSVSRSATLFFLCASILAVDAGSVCAAAEVSPGEPLPPELDGRIALRFVPRKREAYPGERVPLTVTLATRDLTVRDVEYPRISHRDLSVDPFAPPAAGTDSPDGIDSDTLTFTTRFSAAKPGSYTIGPATLAMAILLPSTDPREAFLGGVTLRKLTLSSDTATITILPFPARGKPPGFGGAVGNFSLSVEARPASVVAGDPVVVRTTVRGTGNLDTVTCPGFAAAEGLAVHEPTSVIAAGARVCEQVVIPLSERTVELPPVSFSYFEPEQGEYRTVRKGPIHLKVSAQSRELDGTFPAMANPTAKGSAAGPPASLPAAGRRARPSLPEWDAVVLAVATLLSGVIGYAAFMMLRRREHTLPAAAVSTVVERHLKDAEMTLGNGDVDKFYTSLFRALQAYLGALTGRPPAGIIADVLDTSLPAEMSGEQKARIRDIFHQCDLARYGAGDCDPEAMRKHLDTFLQIMTETPPTEPTRQRRPEV